MAAADSAQQLALTCKTEFPEYIFSAEENECWSLVSVQAPVYVEEDKGRAPLDLVAVVDVSGSMRGEKLNMVKETLKFVVGQMSSADRLGVVLYDTDVHVLEGGMVTMSEGGKTKMLDHVSGLCAGTSTNLSGGLVQGLSMIEAMQATGEKKNEVASVLLMTDGQANVGYTSINDIIKCLTPEGRATLGDPSHIRIPPRQSARRQRQALSQGQQAHTPEEPIKGEAATAPSVKGNVAATVYTFGFGAQHNADLLQAISEAANGMYYFIDSAEKIPESFADCLGGLLSTVAQNISIELKTSNGVNIVSVFSGRDKKSSASGATCTLPLGDIQSEERRDIVLKLSLPTLESEQMEWSVLQAKLSYFNVITSTMETKEFELTVSRPSTKREGLESDEDVDTHKNRVMAAEAMQEAIQLADRGDMGQAQGVIDRVTHLIAQSKSAASPISAEVMSDMLSCQEQMASPVDWQRGGKHKMKNMKQKHAAQRSNVSSDNVYTTKARGVQKKAVRSS